MEELDLKYLQYALAVVRYGSVTQAARALYLAQPNLSRAIRGAGAVPGLSPVPPYRQGMSLTPQGERVLTEAETLLDRLSDLAPGSAVRRAGAGSTLPVSPPPCLSTRCWRRPGACRTGPSSVRSTMIAGSSLTGWKGGIPGRLSHLWNRDAGRAFRLLCPAEPALPPLAQSRPTGWSAGPAASTTRRRSRPSIRYDEALLMLNVTYFDPIGVHFQPERSPLPRPKGSATAWAGRATWICWSPWTTW